MTESRRALPPGIVLLAGLFLLAILLRLPGLTRSLGHDEVYTWIIFASKSYVDIFTSYHLPNNHILHTLFVRFAAAVFGDAEWSLRLPALVSGLLAVPVLFGFARRLTQSDTIASGAALLLAVSTVHVGFSQQARGYTLLVLLCLLHAWTLLAAIEQLRADADPPDHEWLPWTLAALAGALAVLTLPSAAFFVGACAFGGAALIRLDVPRPRWHRCQLWLFLSTAGVAAVAALVYVPRLDDLYSHAQRFGVPLSVATWPAFVAHVWMGIGPQRWHACIALVSAAGSGLLLVVQHGRGLFLLAILALPLLMSLAVATGGEARVYTYLLPFALIAAVTAADGLIRRCHSILPARPWALPLVRLIALVSLLATFSNVPTWPQETGYRDAGRWVSEQSRPGDVVIIPYIVDSAVGYYSGGLTVQRVREAVTGTVRRLFVVTRPGVARFDLDDLMLASNFTTEAARHLDAHRNWVLPAAALEPVGHFGLTAVSRFPQEPRAVDLGELTDADSWHLYAQTSPDTVHWSQQRQADGSPALHLHVQNGAAVLHTQRAFVAPQDGLLLLGYSKSGGGYASLFETSQGQPQALQMARAVSANSRSVVDGVEWFHELYVLPVQAGTAYGIYISAGGPANLTDWGFYFVTM